MRLFTNPRDYTELEEGKLIKKAMQRDEMAFVELMKRYESYFVCIAYRYVKNEQDVLDIIQELAYIGFLKMNQLKEPSYFKTWMTRILINLSIHSLNKITYLEMNDNLRINEGSMSIEEKIDLESAIKQLRQEYQEVISLRYFHDLSIKEIAVQLGMKESTVKSHLRRGRTELKKLLEGEEN